jgi:hypothetical protein
MKSLKFKLVVAVLAFAGSITAFLLWGSLGSYSATSGHAASRSELTGAFRNELIIAPHSGNVRLLISSEKIAVKVGEKIPIKVAISNKGSEPVSLVHPGDGSEHAWRTPIIGWSIIRNNKAARHPLEPTPSKEGRCGLMNPLKADEVFRLEPGESRELESWAYLSPFEAPGIYRVAFLYANRPSMKWRNEDSFQSDSVLSLVKQSTEITTVSNEIVFTVGE